MNRDPGKHPPDLLVVVIVVDTVVDAISRVCPGVWTEETGRLDGSSTLKVPIWASSHLM